MFFFFVCLFFFKVRSRQGGAEADRLSRVGLRGSEVRVTQRHNDCDCEQDTKLAMPEYLCSFKKSLSVTVAGHWPADTLWPLEFLPLSWTHTQSQHFTWVCGRTDERKETATGRRELSQRPWSESQTSRFFILFFFFSNPHFQTFSDNLLERSMTTRLIAACQCREPCTVTFHEIYAVICYLDSSLYDTPILRKHSKHFFFPPRWV